MGLTAENTHICGPKKWSGDQKATPRRVQGECRESAGRVRQRPRMPQGDSEDGAKGDLQWPRGPRGDFSPLIKNLERENLR